MERTPWVFTRQNGEKSAFWIVLHCIAPPKGLPYPFVTPLSQTYSTSFHRLYLSVYKERKHFPCSRLFSSFSPLACLLRNRVLMAVWQLAAFGDFRDEMCSPRERAKRKRKGIGKWGPSLIFSNVSNRPRHLLRRETSFFHMPFLFSFLSPCFFDDSWNWPSWQVSKCHYLCINLAGAEMLSQTIFESRSLQPLPAYNVEYWSVWHFCWKCVQVCTSSTQMALLKLLRCSHL